MKLTLGLLGICVMAFSTAVFAGEAHVCRSSSAANTSAELTDNTVFTCGGDVNGTIPQLAQKGWKIVQQVDQVNLADPTKIYAQLIIQKD